MQPQRVLVVEDDPIILKNVCKMAEETGANVRGYASYEALHCDLSQHGEILSDQDVIVLDCNTDVDGSLEKSVYESDLWINLFINMHRANIILFTGQPRVNAEIAALNEFGYTKLHHVTKWDRSTKIRELMVQMARPKEKRSEI